MNLKPNQHKTISFNTTTVTPLEFTGGGGGGGGGSLFWTNLCDANLKVVYWCIDGDIRS